MVKLNFQKTAAAVDVNRGDRLVTGAASTRRHSVRQSNVLPAHLRLGAAYLEARGVSLEALRAAGAEIVPNARLFDPIFPCEPAILFRFYDPMTGSALTYTDSKEEEQPFVRIKRLIKGKPKFLQPRRSGTHVYFAPQRQWTWRHLFEDTAIALVISEGETRALAGAVCEIPIIALTGADCGEQKGKLHSDLEPIRWEGRTVYLAFDSDASYKDQVQRGLLRLGALLQKRDAIVYQVRLPAAPDGSTQGLDDYLARYGREAFIQLTGSPETTPVRPTGADVFGAPNDRHEEVPLPELLKRSVRPVTELIPGWIEKGVSNFLAGPGGVHKSRLALQWGLAIASGAHVWGLEVEPAALVYVSAEDDADEVARRAQAIDRHLRPGVLRPTIRRLGESIVVARKGMDSALVIMGESGQVEVRPFYHQLKERLLAVPGHKVAVLDSAYDFARFAGRAKIDEDSVNFFIKVVLQSLCDTCDCMLIIPWHPSQAGSERTAMDGWSVAWQNAPRARLALKASDIPDTYELSVAKRNHGAKRPPVRLRFHEGALLPLELLPDDGRHETFLRALAKEAIEVAKLKTPLNRRDRIPESVVRACEMALGRRPHKQEIRDGLDQCVRNHSLQFVLGTRHRAAGYYPPDPAAAVELSLAAKRAETDARDG